MDLFVSREFEKLCKQVASCNLCSRMESSQRVLNYSVGNLEAEVMFIGEAPGRLGADDTGIPFHGDKSGHNFEDLLKFAGLSRSQIYVTNAVICNPKDSKGNNATPNSAEIINCTQYLASQIEIVNPKIIVTLGATALEATRLIHNHSLTLKNDVRTANSWNDRILIPLYHPGQRAMLHRSFANQRSDYQFVADKFKALSKKKANSGKTATNLDIALIVEYILSKVNPINYFTLHKLFYLLEYKAFKQFGTRLTTAYIIRQKDGPYCTDLHLEKLKKSIPNFNYYFKGKSVILTKDVGDLFNETLLDEYDIDNEVTRLIDEVVEDNAKKSMASLKKTVYFSRPMRNILKVEKEENVNLYNSPIIFDEQSVI